LIKAERISKDYPRETGGYHRVLSDISFEVGRGEKVALLGRNGAGKSTLIRLLGGVELPTEGAISATMSVSWPVGFVGGLHGSLTGNDNIRFIARVYGKPFSEIHDYVEDFAALGKFLSEPVRTYSTGMRGRLNFALSLAIDFDCYLIDELIAVGDYVFQVRSREELFERRADRALIMASHIPDLIKTYCSRAIVLHRGRAKVFSDLDLALEIYSAL
jgi:capsular polysaccharide transport system ATP-binding protein